MVGHGVMVPIHDGVLCHGGVSTPGSKTPLKTVSVLQWNGIDSPESKESAKSISPKGFRHGPSSGLSHHAGCLIHGGDVLIIVGGTDGRKMSNKVYALDLIEKSWLPMQECTERSGKDTPSGLTGHSVTAINDQLICIVGGQVGQRFQKPPGELFYLHVSVPNGLYYYEHSILQPASRSGHTTVLVRGIRRPHYQRFNFGLFNFGGMASGKIEMLAEFPSEKVREVDIFYDEMNRTRLKSRILLSITKRNQILMEGLRYHASIVLTDDCILVHGGKSVKNKPAVENVNGFLFACLVVNGLCEWYNVPFREKSIPRFGHALVFNGNDLYIVGGFSKPQNKTFPNVEKITIEVTPE